MVVARFIVRDTRSKSLLDRRIEGKTLQSVLIQIGKDIRDYRKRGKGDSKGDTERRANDPLLRWQRIEVIIEKKPELTSIPTIKVTLLGKDYDAE